MKVKRTLLTFGLAAGIAAVPAFASSGTRTQNRDLLQKMQYEAQTTELNAGRMNSYTSDQLDWMAQGTQLMRLKASINALGREVRQIETTNPTPGQQRLISRIAKRVNLMGNDAQDAILFGKNHRDDLWNQSYQKDIRLLYSNAEHLRKDVNAAVNFQKGSES